MRYLLFILFIAIGIHLSAQLPLDSVELDAVEVFGQRMSFENTASIQKYDLKTMEFRNSESIEILLKDYAGVNIKSYGYGGMSNLSMRGGNSNHTSVLWNGINLQDPLNGGFDLNQFPMFIVDELLISKGGNSALYGSGAMGGSIHLNSKQQFNKGLQASVFVSAASFEQLSSGLSLGYSNSKIASTIKFYHKKANYDFEFKNTEQFGHPLQKQSNAQMWQYGVIQENTFLINTKNKFTTSVWYQQNSKNIPPTLSKLSSKKHQFNESLRENIQWEYFRKQFILKIRNASLYSKLNYSDGEINLEAIHKSISNITEVELTRKLRKSDELQIALNNNFEKGISEQFSKKTQRNRIAFFTAYKSRFGKKITTNASIRKEYIGNRFTPFTYGLGISYIPIKSLIISSKISKNYRIPTFNDLYWLDGMAKGNPDLQDESSFGEELSLQYNMSKSKHNIRVSVSGFTTNYSNLILWNQTNGIWSPINKKEVWARGLEASVKYILEAKKITPIIQIRYVFTRSSLEKINDDESKDALHKQLILSPVHQGNIVFSLNIKNFYIKYFQQFVGVKYTTTDNSEQLDAYTLGDVCISWKGLILKQEFNMFLRWNNIWNTEYRTSPVYAMPRNNWELGFKMSFTKKLKSK